MGCPSRLMLSAVLLGGFLVVPARVAGAQSSTTDPTTTTTAPAPTTTPSTSRPRPSAPTPPPTIPADPNGERSALSPEQTIATQAEFATLTDSQRALLRQLQAAKDMLAVRRFALVAFARHVTAARDRLDAARAVESQARVRVDQTAKQLQSLKDEIVDLAAAAYRNHSANRALGAISSLSTTDASTLARAQTYVRSDASLLGARINSVVTLKRRLESEQRSAESARVEAEAGAADLDAQLAAQTKVFDEATDATAKAQKAVARGLGSGATLLAQILDPRFGTDDITAALAFVQSGQPDPVSLDGIFALPILGAPLNSPYGIRIDPIEGTVGYHAGLDFGAVARTPIHAAAAGTVIVAGDCGGYGNCVVIDHGTSLATLYGHQSLVLVHVGDIVAAGQAIGLVGSTGISTGPHLHFEVRLHGAPIDPVPTLSG